MKRAQLAVKMVDEEQGIAEGWGAPYGGPMNGKDLQGEFFSPKTDFCLKWFDTRPILYHHGMDNDLKTEIIGKQIETTAKPEGQWIKIQLDRSSQYWKDIKDLIKAGKLFFSSGSIPHLVQKATSGELLCWPWVETSLTPSPANPGAEIPVFKALAYLKAIGVPDDQLMVLKMEEEPDMAKKPEAKKDFEKPEGSPVFVKDPDHADPAASAMNGDKPNLEGTPAPSASGPGSLPTVSPPPEQNVKADNGTPPPPKPEPSPVAPAPPAQAPPTQNPPVTLPPEVLRALQALQASVNKILSGLNAGVAEGYQNNEQERSDIENQGQEVAGPAGDKPAVPSEPGVNQGMAPETHIEKPAPDVPKKPEEMKNMSSAIDKQTEPVVDPAKTQASDNIACIADMSEDIKRDLCRRFGTQTGMKIFNKRSNKPAETVAIKSVEPTPTGDALKEENKALREENERLKAMPASTGPVLRAVKTTETGAVPNPRNPNSVPDEKNLASKVLQDLRDDPETPASIKSYIGERMAIEEMRDIMAYGPVPLRQNKAVEKEN